MKLLKCGREKREGRREREKGDRRKEGRIKRRTDNKNWGGRYKKERGGI